MPGAGRRALVLLSRFNLRINGKLAKALPFLVEVSSWARGIFKVEKVPRRFLQILASEAGNHSITGGFSIDVDVPRGTLETNPVTVEVKVKRTGVAKHFCPPALKIILQAAFLLLADLECRNLQ